MLHRPTFYLNTVLFGLVIVLSVVLWQGMPERYPIHFGLSGEPDGWAEGPGMWVLLMAICTLSFGKAHLAQRFLLNDPDSALLNVPWKDRFQRLPRERKVQVMRRLNRMLGLLNTGLLLIFLAVMLMVYHTARDPASPWVAVSRGSLWLAVALVMVVPLAETVGVRRMIRRKLQEEGLWPVGGADRAPS